MSAAPAARAGVIVVNWNARENLTRCLTALLAQTRPFDRIILADNASEDDSVEMVVRDFPQIEVLRVGCNAGFARANNLAIAVASDCEFIALVNPDAFLDPAWLEQMLAAASEQSQCAGFGSRLMMADQPDFLDGTGDAYHVSGLVWRMHHGERAANHVAEAGPIFSPCAAAALYRRDALLALGGFDEDFFCYVEDVDLGFRLRLAGHGCRYVPSALAWHVGSASTGRDSVFSVYHGHRNLVWTYAKNMPSPQVWLYLPLHLAFTLAMLVRCAARGRALPFLRAKRDALAGLPRMLKKRGPAQKHRAGWRELSAAMAHGWPRRRGAK